MIASALPTLQTARSYVPSLHGCVVCFGIGIAIYFALPLEPDWIWTAGIGAILWAIFIGARRGAAAWYGWILMALLIWTGVARASWHSAAEASPILRTAERSYSFTGWVEAIERSGKGERVHIRITEIERLPPADWPKSVRLRVTAKNSGVKAGQTIRVRGAAKAPPSAALPGGYNPARAAYFQQIGGFGFTYGAPDILEDAALSPRDRLSRAIVRWRYGMAERIYAQAPPETAGLQAALITGVRRYIPPEQTENLRVSGLAHILAISGLHMGLLAGGVFSAVTFLLACIPWLARRMDIRKPAAVLGIVAAVIYLVLSGASVATQRAFIMTIIVFLAVIFDRRALSLRSVALAALITLALHPEALVSVGFQMSFAAVAALIVTYQAWQRYRPAYARHGVMRRGVNFMTSLSVTSFVAGLATAGFALFHFNRIARYGFLGNLIAMPIFSLAVMPLAVIVLLAMPLGLEYWPLQIMGAAISYILGAADWVAGLDGVVFYAASAPNYVLPLFAGAFIAICLGQNWVRGLGVIGLGASLILWGRAESPHLRVSDTGRVAFWQADPQGGMTLLTDRSRGDRYGREQFTQQAGKVGAAQVKYTKDVALCDALACRAEVNGRTVSIIQHPSEVIGECETADLVILTQREAGPVARRGCGAVLIDGRSLRRGGAASVYISAHSIRVAYARETDQNRPWSRP